MAALIGGLLADLWPYLAAALAGIAAVVGLYAKGRSDGKATERAKHDRANLDAMRQRRETDAEVDRMGDSARSDDWDGWLRDK